MRNYGPANIIKFLETNIGDILQNISLTGLEFIRKIGLRMSIVIPVKDRLDGNWIAFRFSTAIKMELFEYN